ncbi:hypothetical protein LMG33818_002282 [Halomonadaceae bacterium LMG 33818]
MFSSGLNQESPALLRGSFVLGIHVPSLYLAIPRASIRCGVAYNEALEISKSLKVSKVPKTL